MRMEPSRYVPEHPLPKELRELPSNDTACKFCGVSYLIHSEMKALQEKLQLTEQKLERLQKFVDEREVVERKLNSANIEREKVKAELVNALELLKERPYTVKDMNRLEEEHDKSHASIRKHLNDLALRLPVLLQLTKDLKSEQQILKTEFTNVHKGNSNTFSPDTIRSIINRVEEFGHSHIRFNESLRKQLIAHENGNAEHDSRVQRLESSLCSANQSLTSLQKQFADQSHQLEEEQQSRKEINNELEIARRNASDTQVLSNRLRDAEEKLSIKSDECAALLQKFNVQTKELNNIIPNVKEDVVLRKQTEDELRSLQNNVASQKQQIEEITNEREMLIASHHSRIEQLKFSFSSRITEAEQLRNEMAETLRIKELSHAKELQQIKAELVDKHLKELNSVRQSERLRADDVTRDLHSQANELRATNQRAQAELAREQRDKAALADAAAEVRSATQLQIAALRTDLAQSQSLLESERRSATQQIEQLRRDAATAAELLSRASAAAAADLSAASAAATAAATEVAALRETVRRECEERYELTEALADARTELLTLKRPPNGYANAHAAAADALSAASSSSSALPPTTARRHPRRAAAPTAANSIAFRSPNQPRLSPVTRHTATSALSPSAVAGDSSPSVTPDVTTSNRR